MIKFIFDLDGTLTTAETLPLMAQHFGLSSDIMDITRKTIHGLIPFEESLTQRMHVLGKLPVHEVAQLLATVPLYSKIHSFILKHAEHCLIATGNIDVWLTDLAHILACPIHCSTACVQDNCVTKLSSILQKDEVVKHWQKQGYKVVFMGDGDNDVQAMHCADVAIAVAITHEIAPSVQQAAHHIVHTEEEFASLLEALWAKFL